MLWKKIVMCGVCLFLLTLQTTAHGELYLIRRFYAVSPGCPPQPLQIGQASYDVLRDRWTSGSSYAVCAPERDGYVFLAAVSDELTGIFGEEDAYLTLYYTKQKFLP